MTNELYKNTKILLNYIYIFHQEHKHHSTIILNINTVKSPPGLKYLLYKGIFVVQLYIKNQNYRYTPIQYNCFFYSGGIYVILQSIKILHKHKNHHII
jgi:hypothetical protein